MPPSAMRRTESILSMTPVTAAPRRTLAVLNISPADPTLVMCKARWYRDHRVFESPRNIHERPRACAPIDHFFRTLAATHDGKAVGVILSGTGADGALGLKAIRENGGLTLVQDPEEAEYDGMPRTAISMGLVDRVLPISRLPEAI